VQSFTANELVIAPSANESGGRRRVRDDGWLERMELDLEVRTVSDGFIVQNNLVPAIYMVLNLHVGGTVARPRISGEVRPTEGRFHIPAIRGDFQLVPNVNYVTFVGTKSIEEGETPEIWIEAENSFTDSSGQEHDVRLLISGPLRQMRMSLSSGGLDQNQTLLLLVSGRTTDGSSRGSEAPRLGNDVRTGADVVGQLTRDSVAALVEPYIDNTLSLLTGRAFQLRPTIGADGVELRATSRWNRRLQVDFSFLQGFRGQRTLRLESGVAVVDYVSLMLVGEQITRTLQQSIVEDIWSARLELSLAFPIRLTLP
jgi:hypothetical protein